ncbi:orotidine-5'-phosphate decarboxylase [Aliikangiella coralliicola]|uniref:Orotidine 5'-phosphate decarboxylase n=1 Tax=Aliikangiella coralliicola TaxID=2592383 RepID=A0A545U4V0_9GAMM|nr:orotidine-5'-phosphate decarboxylase [Aliikangiella coralliicola]TQV84501.1 orotidine-5'-phosphate decarboxylase [Aliikangiella coralliicola]
MHNEESSTQESKIIVALDFDDLSKAKTLVSKLDPNLCKLKVGKEMFTLFGPDWVRYLVEKEFQVFLDLKFHDIPNTVAKACKAAAQLGVWMVNVHASGGVKMMQAAVESLNSLGGNRPLLTGVTILTSMDKHQFDQIGYQRDIESQVSHFAQMAESAGLDGIVCSALEAEMLRKEIGKEFKLVTPGIRPVGSDQGDQSRVMTPERALNAGANYLVIGRPITQAEDPLSALCEISESVASL